MNTLFSFHGHYLMYAVLIQFSFHFVSGCLGALSAGVALALSPVTVALCVRKSTRVTAVVGGLVAALGCLFTSFATQFHQLFFSYGKFYFQFSKV